MGNKTAGHKFGRRLARTRRGSKATEEKPVALTLKVDTETYIRLSTLRARERKTAQEILSQALREYLDGAGA